MTNRFKGLDLIECLKSYGWGFVAVIKTIPKQKKCKKAKWLPEEALQIAEKRREVKGKGEKERYTQSLLKLMSIESVMPSNHLILCHPILLLPSIFPNVFSNESALRIRWPNFGVSASTSVLPMNTQDWFPLGWTGWISLQSMDSQESSPTPQFKSINSSMLSFPYSPTLTSIRDYWKNHSLA